MADDDGLLNTSASSTASEDRPLTAEQFRAWRKKVSDNRMLAPCTHAVSPKALYTPGTYVCANCGAPVEVPYPLSER